MFWLDMDVAGRLPHGVSLKPNSNSRVGADYIQKHITIFMSESEQTRPSTLELFEKLIEVTFNISSAVLRSCLEHI